MSHNQTVSYGVGPSTTSLRRYFYDKEAHRCVEFTYRGSRGNANNFLSVEDCEVPFF
jgi:hypothetical protein